MVDTIVFDIDLKVNKDCLRKVRQYHERTVNKTILKEFSSMELKFDSNVMRNIHFKIPSSHNDILAVYSSYHNTITINTSIPKFLYGNSVVLLHARHYSNDWYEHFIELKKWIYAFFSKLQYITGPLDYRGIVIRRIDLCLNLSFDSKEDALDYIDECKRVIFPYEKESNKYIYKTSVMFVGRSYSYKIYHKGSEYKKNKKALNYDRILPLAERVVRFELTCQKKYLSYIFRNHVYCKDDYVWKAAKEKKSAVYKKHAQKSIDIYLDLNDDDDSYNYTLTSNVSYAYRLKRDLLEILIKKFLELYKHFDFNLPNNEVPKKVRLIIANYGSYKAAFKAGAISSATYYRHKDKYNDIRIVKRNNVNKNFANWKEFTILNPIIAI